MLIIFSGLPGTGKSTLAKELARQINAVYVRADSIEQRLRNSVLEIPDIADLGYLAGQAVATDNLRFGHTVVCDSVNPWELTRDAWRSAADAAGVASFDVEVVCDNSTEHKRRVETRKSDVADLRLPTWQEVVDRDYHDWTTQRLVVDTFNRTVDECVEQIRAALPASTD